MMKHNIFKKWLYRIFKIRPRWTQEQIDRMKKNGKEMYEKFCGKDKEEGP